MSTPGPKPWYQSNAAVSSVNCRHCNGVLRHESWCITRNANTAYAFRAVQDSDNLSQQDKCMLHSLGVSWNGKAPQTEEREPQPGGILPR
jgi:hypothetical protein